MPGRKLDATETIKVFPVGCSAMGFGSLALSGDGLQIKFKWNPKVARVKKFRKTDPAE